MEEKNEGRSGDRALLRMFLRDIGKHPVLSREEENVVAQRARAGDKLAANLLVVSNLRFVVFIVNKYWRPESTLTLMELVSEGCLGMMKASKTFDPSWGCRFTSYAEPAIRHCVFAAISAYYKHKHDSLDDPIYNDDSETTLMDLIPSNEPGADETVFAGQIRKMLLDLDERERRVILLRFWGDLTLEQTASKIGMKQERTRQLESRALRKLRWTRRVDLGLDCSDRVEINGVR